MRLFYFLKLVLLNLLILFSLLFFVELIFGTWFKNNFSYYLSSERNIHRVYKFNFTNYEGESLYQRDTNAFRFNGQTIDPKKIDIVFSGGSTTNQKFINFEETFVHNLDIFFEDKKIVNAGIDGLSIRGHINSFEYWFDKIDGLKPKFYIFYIGINDRDLLNYKNKSVDIFQESDFFGNLREYLESNSFFYKKFRNLKAALYLKYNFQRGASLVNKNAVVYGERTKKIFVNYQDFQTQNNTNNKFLKTYMTLLNELTNKVKERNSEPIYITQISGYGINAELFNAAEAILKHCENQNLTCVNLAKEIDLNYEDFYDELHLNPKGSKKVFTYLSSRLNKIIN